MSYPSIIHMQSKLCFVQLARPVLMYVQKLLKELLQWAYVIYITWIVWLHAWNCLTPPVTSTDMHTYGFTITVSQLKQLLTKMRFDKNAEQKSMQ